MYFHLVALLLCAAWCENANAFETGRRKLLLVSLDGYRVDYFDRKLMPEFERFRSEGAAVQFVLPTYPSVTFTCHYTIVTGRHADHHGIVANSFFDPSINATFSKSQNTQVSQSSVSLRSLRKSADRFPVGSSTDSDGSTESTWTSLLVRESGLDVA